MKIITLGDKDLESISTPVKNIDGRLAARCEKMYDLLESHRGVGLAAPQISVPQSFFIIELKEENFRQVFINPKIISVLNKTEIKEEGCLSVPGIYGPVERPLGVTLRYLDLDGKEQVLKARGLLARIILHEYDHLMGRLFIKLLNRDYLENIAGELEKIRKMRTKPL
jgi:peptide deformylase